jgi:hypothetical protein
MIQELIDDDDEDRETRAHKAALTNGGDIKAGGRASSSPLSSSSVNVKNGMQGYRPLPSYASGVNLTLGCLGNHVRRKQGTVEKKDAPPRLFAEGGRLAKHDDNASANACCPVCETHAARYSCPRCATPYCSVTCYRSHQEGCTEAFYQGRVASEMALDAKDMHAKGTLANILLRNNPHHPHNSALTTTNNNTNTGGVLSDDELIDLADQLLGVTVDASGQGQGSDAGDEMEEALLRSLPLHIRTAFEQAVQRGELSHVVPVHDWHPWWKPDFVSPSHSSNHIIKNDTSRRSNKKRNHKTMEEQLMQIPSFDTLSGKQTTTVDAPLLLHLHFNVLDILHATASTLWRYCGLENCTSSACRETAAESLLSMSSILSSPTTTLLYTSVPEVMMACSNLESQQQQQQQHCSSGNQQQQQQTEWMRDVALLCSDYRFVMRALLEARDILRMAHKAEQKKKKKQNNNNDANVNVYATSSNTTATSRVFFLASKKVEYYISWCRAHWKNVLATTNTTTSGSSFGFVEEVKQWTVDWQDPSIQKERQMHIHELNLPPASSMTTRMHKNTHVPNHSPTTLTEQPLQEIATRRFNTESLEH